MKVKEVRIYIFRILCALILGALVFECYMFLVLSRDRRMAEDTKTIFDYESVLCRFSASRKRPPQPTKNSCPSQGIVTAFKHGELCKNMWQYANIVAGSVITGLDGYMPVCLKNTLVQVFDNLSLPLLSEIGHCVIPLPESVTSIEDWSDPSQSIVIWDSDLFNDHVMMYLEIIEKDFAFNSVLWRIAFATLLKAKNNVKKNAKNVTYIGVHITNTRIIVDQEYDGFHPSVQFFIDAMNEFRGQFSNALFVVIADHQSFWKSIFKEHDDVYITSEDSVMLSYFGATLSVLAHCNHTILSSEGIAVWGAILSGGRAIVSLCLSENFNSLMQQKEDWNYLMNNSKVENKDFEKFL